ncbi:MAG TPA: hypothetical protein VNA88_16670 [Candidatus Kapabacteria bacterium]|nr:hypothetical protein [Candidatus Kapabacteria bacterium]
MKTLTAIIAVVALLLSRSDVQAQSVDKDVRAVLSSNDSTLVGGLLLGIESASILLRIDLDDTLSIRLDDIERVTLIEERPRYGSAAVVLGLQAAFVYTRLRQSRDGTPFGAHGDYLLSMIPGLAIGGLVGFWIDAATRQPRIELDASTQRDELLDRAAESLDRDHDWSLSQYSGIVHGAVDEEAVYGPGHRRTHDGNAALGDNVTLLRRLEVARRVHPWVDLALTYSALAQPGFEGVIRFEYENTQGPVVVAAPMSYTFDGDAVLLGGHLRYSPWGPRSAVLVRAGAAAGIAVPDVWRNGERFVRGVRPAAIGTVEVTLGLGSTRIGLAAEYLLVGSLELPAAGSRGAPTSFDPSSGCVGIVLGFAL